MGKNTIFFLNMKFFIYLCSHKRNTNMKNYLIRSVVLVQICSLLLVGLLIFMTDMI